ncbi:MAG: hypothetical protein EBV06_17305, partial [Planctomycetia bacterium]|nr:hypothetical protein [Planctomycetia bacterium]
MLALKYLLPEFAGKTLVEARFNYEARITARLQHPGIPPVHEVGTAPDGRPFLAMKRIHGKNLAEKLEAEGPGVSRWLAVFESICQAVGYAHRHHIIHRDLKPGNIMVGAFGEVQVMDWGLAKVLGLRPEDVEPGDADSTVLPVVDDSDDNKTQPGSLLGTPAYMAPEQAIGAIELLDCRSDVFGLGAVLCALLTGLPPYVGTTTERTRMMAAQGKLGEAFARLDACGAEPALIALTKRCLAKDRDERPADAGKLAEEVAHLRRDAEERARAAELEKTREAVEGAERQRRQRLRNGAVTAVVVTLALGVGASAWFGYQSSIEAKAAVQAKEYADQQRGEARDAQQRAEKSEAQARRNAEAEKKAREETQLQKTNAEEQLRRTEWLVYAATLTRAENEFEKNNVGIAVNLLNECQWNLRGWEHAHLRKRFDSSKRTLRGHTDTVTSVAWSPDGQRILTGSWDGTAKVWDALKGQEVLSLKGHTWPVTSVAWSPDGQRILTGSYDNTAKVWDALKGQEVLSLKGHTRWVQSVAWSPDGQRILTGSYDNTAKVWDALKGQEVLSLKGHT